MLLGRSIAEEEWVPHHQFPKLIICSICLTISLVINWLYLRFTEVSGFPETSKIKNFPCWPITLADNFKQI